MQKQFLRISALAFALLVLALASCNKVNVKPEANFTDESYGCSDFVVYKYNKDRTEVLKVTASRLDLDEENIARTFDLANENDNLEAWIEVYDSAATGLYCNDVALSDVKLISDWEAFEGAATVTIQEDSVYLNPQGNWSYRLQILLENARFRNSKGKTVKLQSTLFDSVYVGWLPG